MVTKSLTLLRYRSTLHRSVINEHTCKMENNREEIPLPLSTGGGALVLKSISLFLTGGRNSKTTPAISIKPKTRRKKMSGKEVKCPTHIFEMAKRDTRFLRNEVEGLYRIYRKLISTNKPFTLRTDQASASTSGVSVIGKTNATHEGIRKSIFFELLHSTFDLSTEDIVKERIFSVWDKNNNGLLTVEQWYWGMSIFLKGTLNEKIEYCFFVYDLNADGFISKEEVFQLLKNSLIKHPQDEDQDEGAKDLAELMVRKLDKDKDGKVSLNDYKQSVLEEPLLLETFGRCLPDDRACETFISTMKA